MKVQANTTPPVVTVTLTPEEAATLTIILGTISRDDFNKIVEERVYRHPVRELVEKYKPVGRVQYNLYDRLMKVLL